MELESLAESSCHTLVGGKIVSTAHRARPMQERRRSCVEEARASTVERERAPSTRRSLRKSVVSAPSSSSGDTLSAADAMPTCGFLA